jgi:serine/threonine-protein kinase
VVKFFRKSHTNEWQFRVRILKIPVVGNRRTEGKTGTGGKSHMNCLFHSMLALSVVTVSLTANGTARAQQTLPQSVQRLFAERCSGCHGQTNPENNLNLLSASAIKASGVVSPGNPEQSELWKRISTDNLDLLMPPNQALPNDEQRLIRNWIEQGAEDFSVFQAQRRPVSTKELYQLMAKDLLSFDEATQRNTRYISLQHLHNNRTISDGDLRIYRAGLSKLINSLTWESQIVVPVSLDPSQTLFRIRLDQLGWDPRKHWKTLIEQYPYGLSQDESSDPELASAAEFVYSRTSTRIPVIRVDWFVARASVPPLYHDILQLPDGPGADRVLEERLKVTVLQDFTQGRLVRAGVVQSRVSNSNRLVDRHTSKFGGYYWRSYDFSTSTGKQNLMKAPLGPVFDGNPFPAQAFVHDGGEIIFQLPNRMQAYFLVDAAGGRISKGPIDVVFDNRQPLGNKEVINGLSCIVCHASGMQTFTDTLSDGHTLRGAAALKLRDLLPEANQLEQLLQRDSSEFLAALHQATRSFLNTEDDLKRREPVGAIARQYSLPLRLEDIRVELDWADTADNLAKQLSLPRLKRLGLQSVVEGGVIKRDTWESLTNTYSLFHEVADELGQGIPERLLPQKN